MIRFDTCTIDVITISNMFYCTAINLGTNLVQKIYPALI